MARPREQWVFPGAKCVCTDDCSENGLKLPLKKGQRYTISMVHDNANISKIGSTTTISLAEITVMPNEFWLDRFEPSV